MTRQGKFRPSLTHAKSDDRQTSDAAHGIPSEDDRSRYYKKLFYSFSHRALVIIDHFVRKGSLSELDKKVTNSALKDFNGMLEEVQSGKVPDIVHYADSSEYLAFLSYRTLRDFLEKYNKEEEIYVSSKYELGKTGGPIKEKAARLSLDDKNYIDDFSDAATKKGYGAVLAAGRKSLGLTQEQVAQRLGKTQSNIAQLELGNRGSFSAYQDYAELLGGTLKVSLHLSKDSS